MFSFNLLLFLFFLESHHRNIAHNQSQCISVDIEGSDFLQRAEVYTFS